MALTDEQTLVIENPAQNKILLAGPGTGKSFTILHFVEYLMEVRHVDPRTIYIITFTRAATKELKDNLQKKFHALPELPKVFTLHGFSLRQLVRNIHAVHSLPKSFSIADDFEERYLIKEDMKRYLNIASIYDVHRLFNLLSSNWETLNADTKDWEVNFESPEFIGLWKTHREIYGYGLRSELVYQFKKLLEIGEDVKVDAPIDYLIVDEYQDLNRCDISIVKYLNSKGSKLFVAGDDDQSIYGFRFAYPEAIRNFLHEISESAQFILTECKRCDEEILKLSLNVVRQDHQRIPKTIKSVTGGKGVVKLLRYSNQLEEANNIARLITELHIKKVEYKDMIILMRGDSKKAFSNPIIEALKRQGIPLNDQPSDLAIFNTVPGRFFLGLLKYLIDENNCLALRTILELTPSVGVKTIDSIYNLAETNAIRFTEVCKKLQSGEYSIETNERLVKETLGKISGLREYILKEQNFNERIKLILDLVPGDSTSLRDPLLSLIKVSKIENLEQIPMLVSETSFFGEPPENASEGIRIMTMHKAKGLSADAVFVIAAEDEYIPGKNDISEERRLFYVSLTRARHYLFVTYCSNRTGQQQYSGYLKFKTTRRNLTRYLTDIPTITPLNGTTFRI